MTVRDFGTSSRDREGAVAWESELIDGERETASLRARLEGLYRSECPVQSCARSIGPDKSRSGGSP